MSEAELILREWLAGNAVLTSVEVQTEMAHLLEDMARLRAFVDARSHAAPPTEET